MTNTITLKPKIVKNKYKEVFPYGVVAIPKIQQEKENKYFRILMWFVFLGSWLISMLSLTFGNHSIMNTIYSATFALVTICALVVMLANPDKMFGGKDE